MEWNSVCITVSSYETEQYFGVNININGHIVLQTKDAGKVFRNTEASFDF